MKKLTFYILIILLSFTAYSTVTFADDDSDSEPDSDINSEIAIMYGMANPDDHPLPSPKGYSVFGNVSFENNLFLQGYYSDIQFTPGGPSSRGAFIESWSELGLGFAFEDDWGDFYSLITVENIKTAGETVDGYGAHFGYENQFSKNWKGVLQLGRIKTNFYDWQLIGKLDYRISDNFYLTFVLRDYDKWDYTNYEAGVVLHF